MTDVSALPAVPDGAPGRASRNVVDVVRRAVLSVLRGISQVFLQRNAASGALMLVGLATYSWRLAGLALLGSAVQSGAAAVLGRAGEAEDGLMGYNGALVGAAASLDLASGAQAAVATCLGAIACLPFHALLAHLFALPRLARWDLAVITAPFCIVAGSLLVLLRPLVPPPGELTTDSHPAREVGLGVLNGLAEVFLSDGVLAGLCILAALFIASWKAGLWAVFGAVGAALGGMVVHYDADSLSGGLLGYSAVLVAIAVGVTFRSERPVVWRLLVAAAAVVATIALRDVMLLGPIPVYTWPFVVVTWLVLAFTRRA